MTHEEILKKAIKKAKRNGYEGYGPFECRPDYPKDEAKARLLTKFMMQEFAFIVIFRHDFAKAFWGDGEISGDDVPYNDLFPMLEEWDATSIQYKGQKWQWHLQQMVVAEDPLRYLEKFL